MAPRRKRKTATRVPQAQEAAGVGFNNFPPELRNKIYTIWAAEVDNVGVRSKGKVPVMADHPATTLSRQIRAEFCSVLTHVSVATAMKVKVAVFDLDFAALMTFLNRLIAKPDASYGDFRRGGFGRALTIELSFTKDFGKNPDSEGISKWVKYLARKVPGLEYTLSIKDVANVDRTAEMMQMVHGGCEEWNQLCRYFQTWKWQNVDMPAQVAAQLAEQTRERTALEKAVGDEYNAVYEQMDRRDRGLDDYQYVEVKVETED